jgi:hypothetical protein
MGYDFTIKRYYKVKAEKEYPWPCKVDQERTLKIYPDDVLTKDKNGTYMKHTGLGTFGHIIPDEDVEKIDKEAHLRLI